MDDGGIEALRAISPGRPSRLDTSQPEGLRLTLSKGATEQGFGTEVWMLKRVDLLMEQLYGVTFSDSHVRGAAVLNGLELAKARAQVNGAR